MGETKRKVRSDRKKDVKPTVDIELYECVSRISHITKTPIKDVGEIFCKHGLYSKKVIDNLSQYFRRNIQFNNTLYMGNRELLSERVTRKPSENRTRITIRFRQEVYDHISDLAYALDRTVSTTVAMLLDAAIRNTDILNQYVGEYVDEVLDDNRKKELRHVLKYINKNNPYEDEVTLYHLINNIMDKAVDKTINARIAIDSWLDQVIDREED